MTEFQIETFQPKLIKSKTKTTNYTDSRVNNRSNMLIMTRPDTVMTDLSSIKVDPARNSIVNQLSS
jgi:hypothetical protein